MPVRSVAASILAAFHLLHCSNSALGSGMPLKVDAEDRAATHFACHKNEAAGLLDDAIDGGKAEVRCPCRPPWW